MKEKILKVHTFCVKYHVYYYLLLVLFLAIDLISKYTIESILLKQPNNRIQVINGFFALQLVYNPGAFSGMLGGNLFGQIILVLLSFICGIAMVYGFIKYFNKITKFEKYGLILAASGTIGNLVDWFLMVIKLQEGVIDFLEFDLGFMVWNTFNIADSLLVVGIIMFVVGYLLREYKISKNKEKEREEFYQSKKEDTDNSESEQDHE